MATKKSAAPKSKNHGDLFTWTLVLVGILGVSAIVFFVIRKNSESNIHIPETAFEETKPRQPMLPETQFPSDADRPQSDDSGQYRGQMPAPAGSVLQRAMELVDQGHWDQAEPMLLAELEKDPKNEAILLELAMINILDKHDPKAAQPFLEAAIRLNPSNDAAVEELLGVYEEGQNWAEAVRFFESIPGSESQPFVNYGRGTALLSAGRNAEAIEVLKRSVYEDNNKAFTARESLATAYESTGRWDDASREYEAVINGPYKAEQQRIAKIRLANTYAAQKNFGQARALLEPIVAADPKDRWAARVLDQISARESRQ